MKDFFKQFAAAFKDFIKHPKKLIPTFVLMGIWITFSLMSAFGINLPVLRLLYGVTYSNGGMYGGFFGALGGVFGKAVFAAFVNAIVLSISEKRKLFSTDGLKGVLKLSAAGGLIAAAPFVIAGGVGVLVYWFFNVTSSVQNCVIGLVGAVSALAAAGKQNGLLFSLGFGILGKATKGKAPSKVTVSRILTGFSMGFALGLALTFIRLAIVLVIVGAVMIVAGIVMYIIASNVNKTVAAAVIALLLIPSLAMGTSVDVYASDYSSVSEIAGLRDMLDSGSGAVGSASSISSVVDGVRIGFGKATSELLDNTLNNELYGCPINSRNIGSNNLSTADIEKGASKQSLTVDGLASCYTNGPKGDLIDYSHYLYNVSYNFSIDFTNIVFGKYRITADARGTESLSYGLTRPDEPYVKGNVENSLIATAIEGTWYIEEQKLYVKMDVPGNNGTLHVYLEVERAVPAGNGGESDSEDSESIFDFSGIGRSDDGTDSDDFDDYEKDDGYSYSDIPEHIGIVILISILTSLFGGLGGAAGAIAGAVAGGAASGIGAVGAGGAASGIGAAGAGGAASGAVSDFGDLGRFIKRDEDGDLNVTDPATGQKNLYKNNGDGTYTNPLTGATYTEADLVSSVGSRYENAGLFSQDAAAADQAIAKQREDNQKLSQAASDYSKQKAKAEEELNRQLYVDKLELKYGTAEGDTAALKEAIGDRQERAEADKQYYDDRAEMFDTAVKVAETTQVAADVGVDVLSVVTGPAGQKIKKLYTVGKNMATRLSEAACADDPNKQSMSAAFAMAGFDSLADLAQDSLGGKGFQFTSNVGSQVFKGGMQNLYDGKDFFDGWQQNVTTGAAKGVIDKIGGALQGSQKEVTKTALRNDMAQIGHAVANGKISAAGERALRDMRLITYINNLHAEKAMEVATTAAGDVAKSAVDGISKAYSNISDEIKGNN